MDITKRKNGGYAVASNGVSVGSVFKNDHWTVRGSHITWTATRKGLVLGSFPTRKEAAKFLVDNFTTPPTA